MGSKISKLKGGTEKVRCIDQGTGGTFMIPLKQPHDTGEPLKREEEGHGVLYSNEYIGTAECKYDVGVYFEIGIHRCFGARISIRFRNESVLMEPDPDQVNMIIGAVRTKLEEYSQQNLWSAKHVNTSSLIIACACPKYGGKEIIRGIACFLDVGFQSTLIRTEQACAHGFIVLPFDRDFEPRMLPYKYDSQKRGDVYKQVSGFEMYKGQIMRGTEWCYSVESQRWENRS